MSTQSLLQSFDTWRAEGVPLVLATVYETQGSTYSKAGHRILLAANGDYRGLVSGGCLEGDLAERARGVVATQRALAVTYDLRDSHDELFGLAVGCNGLLRVFLQPLLPADKYEPFATMAECLRGTVPGAVVTVIESVDPAVPVGATLVSCAGRAVAFGAPIAAFGALTRSFTSMHEYGAGASLVSGGGMRMLHAPLRPIPRLLVLGGGLDAVPLVGMAAELGWRVTVADHRPAYVARVGFERAERVALVDADAIAAALDLPEFAAVIVMSHHLPTDRKYLRQLAQVPARYVGVLGPRARRERLLAELGDAACDLPQRLKGPVGLDIGADSPESIALSILAELQATLGQRVEQSF